MGLRRFTHFECKKKFKLLSKRNKMKSEEQSQMQFVEREDMEDKEDLAVDKFTGDINKLEAEGIIYTCDKLIINMKKLCLRSSYLPEKFGYMSGSDELLRRKLVVRIMKGSQALDELLGGGIETLSITRAFGEEPRSGKTQLGHTLCVSTQLPTNMHGGNGKVAYIDTEGTFRSDQIVPIAERFGMDPRDVLDNIIDSIIALFRVDFTGRGELEFLSITEAVEEPRSGKTQLAHTLCLSTQLPTNIHGGNGKVAYIDEGTFRPDRIVPIAERFRMDPGALLDKIVSARAYTYEHQYNLLVGLAAKMAEEPFGLLIIDSIIALFRVDFTGRGELADRQEKLGQMLSSITKTAEEFNAAVYMTNQVSTRRINVGYVENLQDAANVGNGLCGTTLIGFRLNEAIVIGADGMLVCKQTFLPTTGEAVKIFELGKKIYCAIAKDRTNGEKMVDYLREEIAKDPKPLVYNLGVLLTDHMKKEKIEDVSVILAGWYYFKEHWVSCMLEVGHEHFMPTDWAMICNEEEKVKEFMGPIVPATLTPDEAVEHVKRGIKFSGDEVDRFFTGGRTRVWVIRSDGVVTKIGE